MPKKVCVITGANSGIGKEAAIQIAQQDYRVIMACRNAERGEKALEDIKQQSGRDHIDLKIIDLSLQTSIENFATTLQSEFEKIDVIIHNAAIFDITQKEIILTKEGIERVWATNHLGPVLLNKLILNLLKKSEDGRIITISSKGLIAKPRLKINLTDPEFKKRKYSLVNAYYQSKLAQIMYTIWLSKKLESTNITVNAIRVPAVKVDVSKYTNLSGFMKKIYKLKSRFSLSPVEMAKTYKYLATSKELLGITGKHYNEKNQQVKFTNYQKDTTEIQKLMDLTFKYFEK